MAKQIWYFVKDGKPEGPVSAQDLARWVENGPLTPRTLVWRDGLNGWQKAALHFGPDATAPSDDPAPQGDAAIAHNPLARERRGPTGKDGLYRAAPHRGFVAAILVCLRKYFAFSGRASRSEYWNFMLFCGLFGAIATMLDMIYFGSPFQMSQSSPLYTGFSLLVFIPSLSVGCRRLHDVNRSGLWLLWFWPVMIISLLIIFVADMVFGHRVAAALGLVGLVVIGMYTLRLLIFLTSRGDPKPNQFG